MRECAFCARSSARAGNRSNGRKAKASNDLLALRALAGRFDLSVAEGRKSLRGNSLCFPLVEADSKQKESMVN